MKALALLLESQHLEAQFNSQKRVPRTLLIRLNKDFLFGTISFDVRDDIEPDMIL